MPINRIQLGDAVLMDLTQDTVKAEDLAKGKTAHDSSGTIITGTMEVPSGTIDITNNGIFTVKDFEKASVNVAIPSGYIKPEGAINITENGEHIVTSVQKAIVNVPLPEGYIKPSGALEITDNGEYNVTNYEKVNVSVAKASASESGLVTRTLTEYTNNEVDNVGKYALSNFEILEKCVLHNVKTLNYYAFAEDTSLKKIDILGGGTLYGSLASSCVLNCSNIETFIMRNSTTVTKLSAAFFPFYAGQANITRNFTRANWNKYGAVGRLENWSGLTARPTGSITYFTGTVTDENSKPIWLFGEYTNNSTQLKSLVLAETEEEAATLIAQYEEQFMTSKCKFYVPRIMVEGYKAATNWANYADRIRAIEDYPEICG